MKKWLKMTVMSVLALGLSALLIMPASAQQTFWTGGDDNLSWELVGNWSAGFPNSDTDARIQDAAHFVRVRTAETAEKVKLRDGSTLLIRKDGELVMDGDFEVVNKSLLTSELRLRSTGILNLIDDKEDIEHDEGDFLIDMSGSSRLLVNDLRIGRQVAGSTFTFNVSGFARFVAGRDGDIKARRRDVDVFINVTGNGTLDVDDEFDLRTRGTSVVNVVGPNVTFNIKNFKLEKGNHTLNFTDGAQGTIRGDVKLGDKNGVHTINISGGSFVSGIDDLILGDNKNDDGAGTVNVSGSSTLLVRDDLQFRGDGTAQVYLSDDAVFSIGDMKVGDGVPGKDFVDFQDNAVMFATDTGDEGKVQDAIADSIFTAQTGGYIDFDLTTKPGEIFIFRVPVELGEIPDIDVESTGRTPLHIKLTGVNVSTLLVGDPELGGTPVSPVNTIDNGTQTIIHVSTAEMVANGVLNAATTSLRVTGELTDGTPFWVFGLLNVGDFPPALSAVPEPTSLILLGLGGMGLMFRRRR